MRNLMLTLMATLQFCGVTGYAQTSTLPSGEAAPPPPPRRQIRSVNMDTTTGLRPIQVHIVGEVAQPATYLLEQPARLTTALQVAGGLNRSGSERRIRITSGKQEQIIDLFRFNTSGDLKDDPYLFDNDIIFVPLKDQVIEIDGPVKRPGEYELLKERSLKEIIELAGGFAIGIAKFMPIRIIRYNNNKDDKKILEVTLNSKEFETFPIQNGDVIVIPHLFTTKNKLSTELGSLPNDRFSVTGYEARVFVVGGVKLPGAFPFSPHYKLSQYFALAGGGTILAKKTAKIIATDGSETKVRLNDKRVLINPGDTIIVNEKKVSTEFWIGFLGTIASLGLSAVAILRSN